MNAPGDCPVFPAFLRRFWSAASHPQLPFLAPFRFVAQDLECLRRELSSTGTGRMEFLGWHIGMGDAARSKLATSKPELFLVFFFASIW